MSQRDSFQIGDVVQVAHKCVRCQSLPEGVYVVLESDRYYTWVDHLNGWQFTDGETFNPPTRCLREVSDGFLTAMRAALLSSLD